MKYNSREFLFICQEVFFVVQIAQRNKKKEGNRMGIVLDRMTGRLVWITCVLISISEESNAYRRNRLGIVDDQWEKKKSRIVSMNLSLGTPWRAIELITRLLIRLANIFVKPCYDRPVSLYTQVFNLSSKWSSVFAFFFYWLDEAERVERKKKFIIFKIK